MRSRAFTLIEVVVVIGILLVLSALSYPVLSRQIKEGQITQEKTRLRQNHLAMSLYMADYPADVAYRSVPTMYAYGIASVTKRLKQLVPAMIDGMQASACPKHPKRIINDSYWGLQTDEHGVISKGTRFLEMWEKLDEQSPLFSNGTCNDHSVDLDAYYVKKYGYAVTYAGNIVVKKGVSNERDSWFWIQ